MRSWQVKDGLELHPYPNFRRSQLSEHIYRKLRGFFSEPFGVAQNTLRDIEHYTQCSFRRPVRTDRPITGRGVPGKLDSQVSESPVPNLG